MGDRDIVWLSEKPRLLYGTDACYGARAIEEVDRIDGVGILLGACDRRMAD